MQELEKILEEIRKAFEENTKSIADEDGVYHFVIDGFTATYLANKVIRMHMNGGWIPVEDHLPNHLLDCEVTLRNWSRSIARYVKSDGCWVDHNDFFSNVIAWKEPSEPYRPERSEGE